MSWLNLGAYTVTAVLAILGVLVSILGSGNANTKALWIFLFIVVASGSIGLNYLQKHEEERLAANRDQEIGNLQSQLKDQNQQLKKLLEFVGVPGESEKVSESLQRLEERLALRVIKKDSLKQRVGELSTEILRFLVNRGEVPLPRRETWERDTDRLIQFSSETMKLYSLNFGARVIAARNELAEKGLTDKELDMMYQHPTNPIGMRIVGERLGALAIRLPD